MAGRIAVFMIILLVVSASAVPQALSQRGSRPAYVYDNAGVISEAYEIVLDEYLRRLDDATTNEIVVYTIPSFVGHGIQKDGVEIQDRDFLANYIFNEATLDGMNGIGKAGKDNGVLILFSLEPDASGGSMRIEVGRGLEGDITDGTAGQILDSYLVPARQRYGQDGHVEHFDNAFLNTVYALAGRMGYEDDASALPPDDLTEPFSENDVIFLVVVIAIFAAVAIIQLKYGRRRRRFYGGWSSGSRGGGGFGGGGGGSGGGGAGR